MRKAKAGNGSVCELLRVLRSHKQTKLVTRHLDEKGGVCVGQGGDAVIPTPVDAWTPNDTTYVKYLCSFCKHLCDDPQVEHNPVLASPYVVSCGRCVQKMSQC